MFHLSKHNLLLSTNQCSIIHVYFQNGRIAKTLTIGIRLEDEKYTKVSRSCHLSSYKEEDISRLALSLIQHLNNAPILGEKW